MHRAARLLTIATLSVLPVLSAWALTEEQQRARLKLEVEQAEEQIRNSGDLYGDPALDAYLQSVLDRLFPDQPGKLRVRVISDSEFNAFAMPSGGIYFNTGALLRIQDEAQLASVLGHEGTHYTGDHGYLSVVHGKSTAAWMMIGVIIDPLLAQIAAVSSMAGYSREHERDADRGGFERMAKAGYDVAAGAEIFQRLDRELVARKVPRGGYFYADHPRVAERVSSFQELAKGVANGGERDATTYLAKTEPARMAALLKIHQRSDGALLIFLLDNEGTLAQLPPSARYYLAEGFRMRNGAGDEARAQEEYLQTTATAPDFAPPYHALGMMHYRAGRKPEALAMFEKYLALDPNGKQAAYARSYVERLKKE
jgi:beta-barrel assembly-enhancing protease